MKTISKCRLVDVLGEWGRHEGEGRLRCLPRNSQGDEGLLKGVEIALTYRSPLIWRILFACPLIYFRIEILPEDIPAFRIGDGRSLEEWTASVTRNQDGSGVHVRSLAEGAGPVSGPLTCTAQIDETGTSVRAPIVIFDGWHRAAAWAIQLQRGANYPITGLLIVTQNATPLLGTAI